ncbi:MAG: VPDSG-CTERM sorting domain-containing protein [Chthoniobacterales bacterium]|nr:VPDSG-CTERM sorting domain-containing protein [Chthoniobacterales bacterium]
MKIKTILLAALAATALVSARADEVTIAGSTSGSFSATGTNAYQKLTFNSGTFDQTTFLNQGGVGGAENNNFGTMHLGSSANPGQTYSGSFDLFITFTAPAGITGGQDATYTALVQGTLGPKGSPGGVSINFANGGAQTFTFNSGSTSGSFTLTLNNLSISPGRTVAITGFFTGSQDTTSVPDGGATVALLGLGLVGVAALRRKLATA